MVELVADAVRFHAIHEKTLRLTLAEIAGRSYGNGATVNQALEEGWRQDVAHSMADGIISQHEEIHLRLFRDQLALNPNNADTQAAAQLDQAWEAAVEGVLRPVYIQQPLTHGTALRVTCFNQPSHWYNLNHKDLQCVTKQGTS